MRRPFLAFVVAALSVSYLLPACGGKALVSECQSDADCELGYELCIQGTCHPSRCADCDGGYPPEPPPPPVCESTPKCKEAHPGEEWACLRPGKEDCVKVTSAECPFVSPTWERIVGNVQPLWIGGLFALETKGPNGSLQPSPANQAQLNAMELARREWHATLDGFQVATARDRQPLVAVACDTKNDPARIAAATNHLKKLGVASIIVGSSADAQIALSQPTAGAALYYCADCEPADFPTSGFAGRLVHYRPDLTTSVPPAARAWLEGTEARLRAEGPLANGASLRVAYVTTSAPRRVTAARNIKGALVFNGMSAASQPTDYLEIVTANPIDYATVASKVESAAGVRLSRLGLVGVSQFS